MPVISEEGKIRRGRGLGEQENYKPWILTRELNSIGTTANVIDWKHGRTIQLLSGAEEMYYYVLRWDDRVVDIREQYPLNLSETVKIAERIGVKHPRNNKTHMTTDLYVTYDDGTYGAFSVKYSRKDVDCTLASTEEERKKVKRTAEKLMIEKLYWQEKGVKFNLVFREDLQPVYVDNIRRAVTYFRPETVHDRMSCVKHLIATKQIKVDMFSELDYNQIARNYLKGETSEGFITD